MSKTPGPCSNGGPTGHDMVVPSALALPWTPPPTVWQSNVGRFDHSPPCAGSQLPFDGHASTGVPGPKPLFSDRSVKVAAPSTPAANRIAASVNPPGGPADR